MKSRLMALVLALGTSFGLVACDSGEPDSRLRVHEVETVDAAPSAEAIAWVHAVAQAHRDADAAKNRSARLDVLRAAMDLEVPEEMAVPGSDGELLTLELAARLCETLLEDPAGASEAVSVLAPMLDPEASLPVDRASARALVALGDAGAQTGDLELAAGSYARALRLMTMIRKQMEKEVGL